MSCGTPVGLSAALTPVHTVKVPVVLRLGRQSSEGRGTGQGLGPVIGPGHRRLLGDGDGRQVVGPGLRSTVALHLDRLPTVIVDTRERLNSVSPTIKESPLPASAAQTFHYRYRGLHLLIQGKDRLFLVPGEWSPSDFTMMLPLDGSVRLQFQFENSPP